MTRLPDWLTHRARTHAEHPALEFEGDTLCFAELDDQARRYEHALRRHGIGSEEVVATLLPNRPELAVLAHAIPRGRRVFAPLGIRLKPPEIESMLASCGARALLYDRTTRNTVAALAPVEGRKHLCIDGEALAGDEALTPAGESIDRTETRIDLADTHTIVFTSGSSGRPKAVRLTWGNHYWSAMGSALNLGLVPDDRLLCCLPLNHVGGLSILQRSLLYGHTVELHRKFDPAAVNQAIHRRAASVVSVVANMLQRMLDAHQGRPYPDTLRAILVGGGATPEALVQRCRRERVPILLTYGLTETASQVATMDPGELHRDVGVGRPLAFAEVRITDAEGAPTPNGTHGHIEVRGPIVSPGYWGDDDRTDDEWLHTRDRGWLDENGALHVLGRGDETIVCGGENVHPREAEGALEAHPAVAEAFATGIADPRWGHVLHAAVRLVGAADESELKEHCRTMLAAFKVPHRIAVVDDFPRTPAGKIARAEAARAIRESASDEKQPAP